MRNIVLSLSLFGIVVGIVSGEATDYCEHFANCLDHLEKKQRECLKLPESDSPKENSQLLECQRKRRRKLQLELAWLQLRKTELVGDCVSEHMDRAESILIGSEEKRCESLGDKMSIINEILLNPKSLGSKQSKKRRQNSKQLVRFCRRSKKMLRRKCQQLSKCCSISKECELKASGVNDQILSLKRELRRTSGNGTCTV